MVYDNEFNKFKEKYKADIPEGKDLFVSFHFVECNKGMRFTVRWISDGVVVKEETKELQTNREGIISYPLEGSKAKGGSYKLELYSEKRMIHDLQFIVK